MATALRCRSLRVLAITLGIATLAFSRGAEAAWTITLVNETGIALTYYDLIIPEPPTPPMRLPSGTVAVGGRFNIDPTAVNPVYAWDDGINLVGTAPNGFFIGLDLVGSPARIQYKRFHYKVVPGTAGSDPARQPILLVNQVVEVTEGEVEIVINSAWIASIGPPGETGVCCTTSGCAPGTATTCSGTFVPGAACTPGLCSSTSETVGPGGGRVETPDGRVSVEFPEDCLTEATTIAINESDRTSLAPVIDLVTEGETIAVFAFEPDSLAFCDSAELCMSIDITDLAFTDAQRDDLTFLHQKMICFAGDVDLRGDRCTTDGECGTGGRCGPGLDIIETPPCEFVVTAGREIATCCANISHFSEYGLVAPGDETLPLLVWFLGIILLFLVVSLIIFIRIPRPGPR